MNNIETHFQEFGIAQSV